VLRQDQELGLMISENTIQQVFPKVPTLKLSYDAALEGLLLLPVDSPIDPIWNRENP
jgi:hypothetical protein